MASKHHKDFIFLRHTLYEQTIFTVYRFTFSTNNFLWLCALCFLKERTTSKHKQAWVTNVPRLDPSMEVIRCLGVNGMVIRCSMKRAVRVCPTSFLDQSERADVGRRRGTDLRLMWGQYLCGVAFLTYLILTDEFLVWDMGRQIRVQEGAESKAVTPTAAEVGHINILQARKQRGKKKKQKKKWLHTDNEFKVPGRVSVSGPLSQTTTGNNMRIKM